MAATWMKIAHRGASGTRPELTEAALRRALEIGVDMIEIDVQLTADDQIVVLHDLELGRTLAGTGLVREHELSALQALDAGSWFDARFSAERVLTLRELVEIVAGKARLNVEVKSPRDDWKALVPQVLHCLRDGGIADSTVISCFEMDALAAVRESDPAIGLGVLWFSPDFGPAWQVAEALRAVSIHPYFELVDAALCDEARRRGLDVLAWTVNDVKAMRTLAVAGAAGIMSDFPERFAELS